MAGGQKRQNLFNIVCDQSLRTILLNSVRENCHFLIFLPTPMSFSNNWLLDKIWKTVYFKHKKTMMINFRNWYKKGTSDPNVQYSHIMEGICKIWKKRWPNLRNSFFYKLYLWMEVLRSFPRPTMLTKASNFERGSPLCSLEKKKKEIQFAIFL